MALRGGRAVFSLAKKIYHVFLQGILVKLYRVYLFFYRKLERIKPKMGRTWFHLLTERHVGHAVVIIAALLVTSANLNAYNTGGEEFGYDTMLYSMIEHDTLGYIIEEKVDYSDSASGEAFLDTRLSADLSPLTNETVDEEESNPVLLTEGGQALLRVDSAESETRTRESEEEYLVQEGDTLSTIAEKFAISVNTILWANNLTAKSLIRPGQKLTILPVSGVSHTVKRGENISTIAKKYDIDPEKIVGFNKLASAEDIFVDQKLIIPDGKKLPTPVPQKKALAGIIGKTPKTTALAPSVSRGDYIWPTSCHTITQYYGWTHTGIDIGCGMGKPIYASADGTVVKASYAYNGGYGYMVLIDHGGVQTLYAHNSELYVSNGDTVTQGQVIAAMGSTGRSTGPHSHFEVRLNGTRQNPLSYVK